MKSLYIGYRSIIQLIAVLAFNSFISGPKCWLGHSSISNGCPDAVLHTVLHAICIIHYAQFTRAYIVYLLYCGIVNFHWCQLCSIPIWAYAAKSHGERVFTMSYTKTVYSLHTPSRYMHGNYSFSTRAHCYNNGLAHCMPSTVPFASPLDTYTTHDPHELKVQSPSHLSYIE